MSDLLNVEDCELVEWAARVAKAYDRLTVPEQLSLEAWRAAGEPFSSWPGWEQIVGSRPVPLRMKADSEIVRIERATNSTKVEVEKILDGLEKLRKRYMAA